MYVPTWKNTEEESRCVEDENARRKHLNQSHQMFHHSFTDDVEINWMDLTYTFSYYADCDCLD